MNEDIRVVVMAGGSGTRFWPLSRAGRPKQFLPIISERTMVEETVERLAPLIPLDRIHTIANAAQTRTIRELLPGLPAENALIEPQGRNTAPSLILATAEIHRKAPGSLVVVLPSDHLIERVPIFLEQLSAAAEAGRETESLVTFGIPPTFPATGYGYIQADRGRARTFSGHSFLPVLAFKEKPSRDQAVEFLEQGGYYWNSGMFIWRTDVFAASLEAFAPEFHPFWRRILEALSGGGVEAVFSEIPAISIDFALMEKAEQVLVCPARYGWSDVGAWSSLLEVWPKDARGNALRGKSLAVDSARNLVYSPNRLTALIGVEDLIVVDTEDALLVCRKDQDQMVKDLLEALKRMGKEELL